MPLAGSAFEKEETKCNLLSLEYYKQLHTATYTAQHPIAVLSLRSFTKKTVTESFLAKAVDNLSKKSAR